MAGHGTTECEKLCKELVYRFEDTREYPSMLYKTALLYSELSNTVQDGYALSDAFTSLETLCSCCKKWDVSSNVAFFIDSRLRLFRLLLSFVTSVAHETELVYSFHSPILRRTTMSTTLLMPQASITAMCFNYVFSRPVSRGHSFMSFYQRDWYSMALCLSRRTAQSARVPDK